MRESRLKEKEEADGESRVTGQESSETEVKGDTLGWREDRLNERA